jgi:alkaline phosphatase
MQVIQSPEDFYILPKNIDSVAGLFAPNHTPNVTERKPQLHELTQKAIQILSKNKKGFFLMVEGSQIDWAAHNHQQDLITTETLDFDKAVGVGLDFAQRNRKTLIIVTADHETGGFAIHNGSVEDRVLTASGFTTKGHTAAMVPLFAYGPGCSHFAGIQDNTHIGKQIIHLLH